MLNIQINCFGGSHQNAKVERTRWRLSISSCATSE